MAGNLTPVQFRLASVLVILPILVVGAATHGTVRVILFFVAVIAIGIALGIGSRLSKARGRQSRF